MRLLITGANGFIGSFVVELAKAEGLEVVPLVRTTSDLWRLKEIGCEHVLIMNNYKELKDIFIEYKPDVVIHLASYVKKFHTYDDVYRLSDSIVSLTSVLLDAMRETNTKNIVYAGTSFEYDRKVSAHRAGEHIKPYDLYAALKQAAQKILDFYVDKYSFNSIVIRPFFVYGYRDNPHKLIPYLVRQILEEKDVLLTNGEQLLDYIYVKDVAKAFLQAAYRLSDRYVGKEEYPIGSGKVVSLREIALVISRIIGKEGKIHWGAKPYADDEIFYLKADITAAINYLKWRPQYSIEDGLREVVNYYL